MWARYGLYAIELWVSYLLCKIERNVRDNSCKSSELSSSLRVPVHRVVGQNRWPLHWLVDHPRPSQFFDYASLGTADQRIRFCQSWDHLWFVVLLV